MAKFASISVLLSAIFLLNSCSDKSESIDALYPKIDSVAIGNKYLYLLKGADTAASSVVLYLSWSGQILDSSSKISANDFSPEIYRLSHTDLNNDGLSDLLFSLQSTRNAGVIINYKIFLLQRDSSLKKPILLKANSSLDYFTDRENIEQLGLINYNLKLLPNNLLMFQNKYNGYYFVKIKNDTILPLYRIINNEQKFEYSYWNNKWEVSNNIQQNDSLKSLLESSVNLKFHGE